MTQASAVPANPPPPAAVADDAEARFRREVDAALPRNFTAHLLHGMFGQTGFRLIQAPTFLPAYVYALSGSSAMVGLARTCQALGTLLTPMLGASLIEHRKRVLPMVFGTGLAMRLSVLGMALAGFWLGTQANLIAICVCMAMYGLFTGMQSVTFSFLVSKVIPVERRGAMGGVRSAIGGTVASSVGFIGGYIVDGRWLGNGYASVFLVAFAFAMLGLCVMLIMREPESPEVRVQQNLRARMRDVPGLLRSDASYRGYVLARALGAGGRMAFPYYAIYAGERMHLSGAGLGSLTFAFMMAHTLSNMAWGLLADRRGFRAVLGLGLAVWIGSLFVLMNAPDLTMVAVAFVGLGAGMGGFELSCTNLVLEFGKREDLPMRIAVAQTAEQSVTVVAPLLGGVLIEALSSYEPMFVLTALVQCAALAVTMLKVEEPRRRVLRPQHSA
jgi:MFS family permease